MKPQTTRFFDENNVIKKIYLFTYDKNKKLNEKKIIDGKGQLRIEIKYNENEIINRLTEYNENGKIKVIEKYNEDGNKIEENWFTYKNNQLEFIDRYNENGKLFETRKFVYDRFGKRTKTIFYDSKGKIYKRAKALINKEIHGCIIKFLKDYYL